MPSRSPANTALLAILACLLWSTAFAGIKIGLKYSAPLSFAGIRFMISGLLLTPFWWNRRGASGTLRQHFRTILTVGFFQTFLLYGLFYFGMTMVPAALAAIVIGASPLTAATLAHFCMAGDEMTLSKAFSLCLGVAGVVVLSLSRHPWASATGLAEFAGILILLLSSAAGALGNILVARERNDIDPVLLNSAQIFLGGLLLLLCSFPLEGAPVLNLPWEYYAALLWLALLSAAAFSLWFILLKRPGVKVSALNLWKFIIPVFGAVLSWALLPDESPQFAAVAGMICIASSIVLFNLSALLQSRRRQLSTSLAPSPGSGGNRGLGNGSEQ